jgi:hypothetical protein
VGIAVRAGVKLGIGGQTAFETEGDADLVVIHGPLEIIRHEEIAVGRNALRPLQETQRPVRNFASRCRFDRAFIDNRLIRHQNVVCGHCSETG